MTSNRQFFKIGKLVKDNREKTGTSQLDLAKKLGYKNGQFISNVERGICTIPFEKIANMSEVLAIPPVYIIEAMGEDFKRNVKNVVSGSL